MHKFIMSLFLSFSLTLSLLLGLLPHAHSATKNIPSYDPVAMGVQNKSAVQMRFSDLTHQKEAYHFSAIGKSTFSFLLWDLYNSTLMTTTGNYPVSFENEKLIFHIEYLMDINKTDLIERTVEQWQHIGLQEKEYSRYIDNLKTIWPNIIKGDSLSLLMQKDKSIFYYNDMYLGEINDSKFGHIFIDIWLSNKTSQPKLRDELLGVKR